MSQLARILRTAARVRRTRYPGFIFGLPPARREIPVFTYHDVESGDLARDLEFLDDNGYRTLSLEEYLAARSGKAWRGRAVLLTFDDARKSFWQVALPLLRTFDARAVLFAPSYWMGGSRRAPDEPGISAGEDLFMSWEQLRACVASGRVDVQSHAHLHALVPISARLVDFASPQALARFDVYDWPMRRIGDNDELGRPECGTPIYRAAPLLSAGHRYVEDGALTQACRDFVARSGDVEFFSHPGWRSSLTAFHDENSRRMSGRMMEPGAFRRLLDCEFARSREEFRLHLGYEPQTIAYPWMLGSAFSLQLAQRNGFRAAFGVALDYAAERRRAHLPIPVFGRLKCDWLRFLPGRQRRNVFAVLGGKLAGFSKVQHLAH